jgi:diguanylate cyclase
MFSTDDYEASCEYNEKTQAFLAEHIISPTPMNYSVIYLYITNEKHDLTTAINDHLAGDSLFENEFMEKMFSRFISFQEKVDKNILSPFEKRLTQTIKKLKNQVCNETKSAESLKKIDNILAKTKYHDSLESVVSFLMGTIDSTHSQHTKLAAELSHTNDEINTLKKALEQSRNDALVDSLTGLLNRRGCKEKLKTLSLEDIHSSLFIDIDHFKEVNDKFGHFIGDKVLQLIAKIIKKNITTEDLAVRHGGEEFLVVMTNKSITEAKEVAERIRIATSNMKLIQRDTNTCLPPISVSIGLADSKGTDDWSSFFEEADDALYQAKSAGRNRCVCSKVA